ncbi:SigB/SigF/SigG family RNA polymerase sigma factor [Actinokineospora bangkokensis]|uniref:RNA polymerase subunit sigma n=1 Tax=Actinokineospora bangkokensis TaxID=1193682 RepID=A0A1Q9LIZ2_9PSEU|nr:SigB/SigF/SigG family RNA polymerase sigma factor [Actinokineospora bangkokensis]OLR91996.1 RNA polymerase subunit sigma [Actinokineospora bangkokensis]
MPTTERTRSTEYDHLVPLFHRLAESADPDERAALRDELVTGHLPLADHIAIRFANRGQATEDLRQVATLGVINAVDRFDPTRGTDFLSFAIPTIMGEVRRYFRDTSWSIRVPRRLKELHLEISAATGELFQRLGRAPTPSELARHLDLPVDDVYEGLEVGQAYQAVSVDESREDGETESPLVRSLGAEDPELEKVEYHEALRPLVAALPERERTILTLRFYGNMTQSQIAQRVGLSQMHVSRLLAQTLSRLRGKLGSEL